ncbi:replication initiation factor domain-containing protein [Clostridioides difficile]|uniref:replication initiation factor domain-containing protein n=1 Tax=Clostridioides difficile TaxID=1496 RepID=UPI002E8E6112|nr:replication initiation factor domain-containing protein [Clostridioides difficile]
MSKCRSFKRYGSVDLVKHNETYKYGMRHTLYIGSFSSEVYFFCYDKNYEQYAKLGITIEEVPIKNRFEIRLKNERAYYAVVELLTHYDVGQKAFYIINQYMSFADKEQEKTKTERNTTVH